MTFQRLAWLAAAVEALVLLHLWLSKELVIISAPSPDKSRIAQIWAAREFPYLSVQSYLAVRDAATGRMRMKHLLVVRDEFADITTAVNSLSWRGSSVIVDVDKSYYSGPTEFAGQ